MTRWWRRSAKSSRTLARNQEGSGTCVKITVALARDVVMLALGSAGMTHELFLVVKPDMVRVWVSIGLLLGPAVLLSWWRARNPSVGESVSPPPPTSSQSRGL